MQLVMGDAPVGDASNSAPLADSSALDAPPAAAHNAAAAPAAAPADAAPAASAAAPRRARRRNQVRYPIANCHTLLTWFCFTAFI
jgi:hypothetical protein